MAVGNDQPLLRDDDRHAAPGAIPASGAGSPDHLMKFEISHEHIAPTSFWFIPQEEHAGEWVGGERVVTDTHDGAWDRDAGEASPGERGVADARDGVADGDAGENRVAGECPVTDSRNRVGDCDADEGVFVEREVTDARDGTWDRDAGEKAVVKRVITDARDTIATKGGGDPEKSWATSNAPGDGGAAT